MDIRTLVVDDDQDSCDLIGETFVCGGSIVMRPATVKTGSEIGDSDE